MTVFEKIKSMNIDEFTEWFENNCLHNEDPCIKWWDKTYCQNCEPVHAYVDYLGKECECSWCEIYMKCRYFQNMDKIPDNKETIKMWLESKAE